MAILPNITGPTDVKALAAEELPALAQEIRERIIQVTARNGGHVGPNLGVVELTIALHRVFNSPSDKFVFDVAHRVTSINYLRGETNQTLMASARRVA